MAKINVVDWCDFKITDIFDVINTKCVVKKDIEPNSGSVPYVTAQGGNNGVYTYISCPDELKDKGNCIMIGGKTLTFSYQKEDFCSNDSHNIILYLKDKDDANEDHFLFLISVLKAALNQKYSWGDSITKTHIVEDGDTVRLPVDPSGNPNWDYMEQYMHSIMDMTEAFIDNLLGVVNS